MSAFFPVSVTPLSASDWLNSYQFINFSVTSVEKQKLMQQEHVWQIRGISSCLIWPMYNILSEDNRLVEISGHEAEGGLIGKIIDVNKKALSLVLDNNHTSTRTADWRTFVVSYVQVLWTRHLGYIYIIFRHLNENSWCCFWLLQLVSYGYLIDKIIRTIAKLSQKSKLKLQLLAEMVIIS